MAASAAGMAIDGLEEWPSHRTSEPGPMARVENRARTEVPLFLAMRAVRLPAAGTGGAEHVGL